jgi:hypothetical protein
MRDLSTGGVIADQLLTENSVKNQRDSIVLIPVTLAAEPVDVSLQAVPQNRIFPATITKQNHDHPLLVQFASTSKKSTKIKE